MNSESPLQAPENGWLDDSPELPLHSAALLIKHGLEGYSAQSEVDTDNQAFADSSVRHILECSVRCLFSEEGKVAQLALKGLLPLIEMAASKLSSDLQTATEKAVWHCARQVCEKPPS